MHRAPASPVLTLLIVGCGFATEPDPGHGDLDGGAAYDAYTGGGGGEGGMGGMGGVGGGPYVDAGIGNPDVGVEPDALLDMALDAGGGDDDMDPPAPGDMGCPGDAGDAGCAPCSCDDGGLCDCPDLGPMCPGDLCVDLGPLCDDAECVDLGFE